jgi:hypothetical protein
MYGLPLNMVFVRETKLSNLKCVLQLEMQSVPVPTGTLVRRVVINLGLVHDERATETNFGQFLREVRVTKANDSIIDLTRSSHNVKRNVADDGIA